MKLNTLIASRPVFIFILLTVGVLLIPCVVIPWWYNMTKQMKNDVNLNAYMFRSVLVSEIENTANLLHPINSSAGNLARVISSSLNRSKLSSSDIGNKVAPLLFQAFSIMPFISQISYIGLEGLFFSYYYDGNHTFAMYSNSTVSSSSPNVKKYSWYKQTVDPDTGKPYGDAIKTTPFTVANATWIQEALNSTNGYASLGNGWNSAQDPLVLNTVSVHGQGVISLGFSVKELVNIFNGVDLHGGSLYLATQNGDVLVGGGLPNTGNSEKPTGDQKGYPGDVSCKPNNGTLKASILNIGETKYKAYCSSIDIAGVQSVYVLAFPYHGLLNSVQRSSKIALILLIVMIAAIIISIFSFVLLMVRAATREMHLCASLIKQSEATQQAERKSMNKSLAFASASHDIRAALAGITGLIELCYEEVPPRSELETNLKQMDGCTKDLVGLLNSILDTSKIEAGKMQLEEEEFDLPQLLEDVVDLFYPVGMKKGVDVVLDSHDGSILKFSRVKGDRGKLRQVLCNLLSNAVKFTFEGQVSVRAWAQKPSVEKKIIASNRNNGFLKHFSCLFYKNKEEYNDLDAVNAVKQNPNSMEFVFEVDDTGKGIPKDKQQSVFENYVQVKETTLGQGGTGLGLGIVQSLVRLMGGEIGIVDKEIGERGTCFRFNVFLTTSETPSADNPRSGDIEMGRESISESRHPYVGLTVRIPTPGFTMCNPSPRLSRLVSSPRTEGSHVVLLIQNEERRRTSHKFMEGLGIKVSVVRHWERLASTLTKIKSKLNVVPWSSSSGKSDLDERSNSTNRLKDVPLSYMEGTDQEPHYCRSNTVRGAAGFVLLVIDASAGPFEELYSIVTEFKRGLHDACCKVVWLEKPTSRRINYTNIEDDKIDPGDDILLKPFHGSRLYQVVRLLPEFGGTSLHGFSPKSKKESTIQDRTVLKDPSSSHRTIRSKIRPSYPYEQSLEQAEGSLRCDNCRKKSLSLDPTVIGSRSKLIHYSPSEMHPITLSEIQEDYGDLNSEKPLTGMKFLVVDDNLVLRKLAVANLLQLGATVEVCENGKEALELVRTGLHDQKEHGDSIVLPYDYILMDCEMPIMNGYEATRQIRQEERRYGVHIPIMALTAHISGDEAAKTIQAGMDLCLGKPLRRERLVEAIRDFENK